MLLKPFCISADGRGFVILIGLVVEVDERCSFSLKRELLLEVSASVSSNINTVSTPALIKPWNVKLCIPAIILEDEAS